MKSKDLKNKNSEQLEKDLFEKKTALSGFYSNISGTKTKNVKEAYGTRKDIARILTEMNARREK